MSNSWDEYYGHYDDWDDSHTFNVRIELKYEDNLSKLGYLVYEPLDDFLNLETNGKNNNASSIKTYLKREKELLISFDVPYDWSIDTDWEDRALSLLGIREEWVIDSSVDNK